jgi:hypothetical protein
MGRRQRQVANLLANALMHGGQMRHLRELQRPMRVLERELRAMSASAQPEPLRFNGGSLGSGSVRWLGLGRELRFASLV